jgi:uncharacterized protein with FMN-binding domain
MKHNTLGITVIFLFIFILLAGSGCGMAAKIEETKNLTINNPDITQIPDGIYEGYYEGGPVKVLLEITVKDHQMINIQIKKHDHGRGDKAEAITESILKAQSLDVDIITGATVSSKAILKAAEKALGSGT